MHDFQETKSASSAKPMTKLLGIFLVVILLGIGSGFALAKITGSPPTQGHTPTSSAAKGTTYGVSDTKAFPDTAEGTLRKGGIEGEGAFHLERPGGESQNVYLTSSQVDLSQLVGKKIKVWGETQAAQHAGWLMDVGKVEVL